MKTVRFHPASLGAGAILCLLVLASLGAVQAPAFVRVTVTEAVPVAGVPAPGELWSLVYDPDVMLMPGESLVAYTVPPDKRLVLRRFEGLDLERIWEGSAGVPVKPRFYKGDPLADGVTFPPNSDVLLLNEDDNGQTISDNRLYGYLVDA